MEHPPLIQSPTEGVVVPSAAGTSINIRCRLLIADREFTLILSPTSDPPTDPDSEFCKRMNVAVRWATKASRHLRGLLARKREARVGIPSENLQRPRVVNEATIPSLGWMLRPLLFQFRPTPELRSFQKSGVEWLLSHSRAILADDMGLGKTLQTLEATRRRVYAGAVQTTLILCPRTLTATWESEARRWAPELTVAVSTAWQGDPEQFWDLARDSRLHIVVVHYDQLKTLPRESIRAMRAEALVLDEAHRVRRAEAGLTTAVKEIDAESVWAISGTPIERDADDLATLMSVVNPERFSPSMTRLGPDAIRGLARPILLRRQKKEVLTDLPEVSEQLHEVDLLPEQLASYSERLRATRSRSDGGELLAAIGDLLAICDSDPVTGRSAKLDHIAEQLEHVALATEKAVVFSYRLLPLDLLERLLTELSIGFTRLDGQMSMQAREAAIDKFRTDAECVVLLASSRVASEGLTLTEANHAFFVNRWWNPSSNDQARDRIVRIGQEQMVVIHSYVCRGTIEERLETIIETKRELVDDVVNALAMGSKWAGSNSVLESILETD